MKEQPNNLPPVLAMSSLGKLGRFGNQLLQYGFLRIMARRLHARIECPEWVGRRLYGHRDRAVTAKLPPAVEQWENRGSLFDEIPELVPYIEKLSGAKSIRVGRGSLDGEFLNVDLWGHFQWHTKFTSSERAYFQSLFEPVSQIQSVLSQGMSRLRSKGGTVIGIHVRRDDFLKLPLFGFTYTIPSEWWREWLEEIWDLYEEPVLFVCSDDIGSVIGDFENYSPVTAADLDIRLPDEFRDLEFYIDFYLLSQCDVLGISNSTFSFVAALMNTRAKAFFRSHWDEAKRVVPFDPWDGEALLYVNGGAPRAFKSFRQALQIEYATRGALAWLKCFVFFPVAWMKIRAKRFHLAFQAQGIAGVLKSIRSL